MVAKFERAGVSFSYPDNWTVEVEEFAGGWSVSVQSPATAFFTLTLDEGSPPPGEFADAALATIQEAYRETDAQPVCDALANMPSVGHDVQFFSFDLTNTGGIRAVAVIGGTLLAIWQGNDLEIQNLAVLSAIKTSLAIHEDD